MIFDADQIAGWNRTFEKAVEIDLKWKKIPASEGRLRAMSKVLCRGDILPHEQAVAIKSLTPAEKVRLNELIEIERNVIITQCIDDADEDKIA
jgi:hypothetical protein